MNTTNYRNLQILAIELPLSTFPPSFEYNTTWLDSPGSSDTFYYVLPCNNYNKKRVKNIMKNKYIGEINLILKGELSSVGYRVP